MSAETVVRSQYIEYDVAVSTVPFGGWGLHL
jgi:hypothetical protein